MTISVRQVKTATGNDVTFDSAPVEGNQLVVLFAERSGAETATISGTNWNKRIERAAQTADTTYRRFLMRGQWFHYLIRDMFPDTESVVYRRVVPKRYPDLITDWGVTDGGQLGALGLCKDCNGEGKRGCDVCDGTGRVFFPYFQSPLQEPQESPTPETIEGKATVNDVTIRADSA